MAQLNSAGAGGVPMDTLFAGASSASKAVKNQHINLRNGQRAQQSLQNSAQQLVITHSKDWWSIISEFVLIGGSLAALGYMFKSLISQQNDPEQNRKQIAEHVKQVLLKKMKKSGRKISSFNTNTYEDSLLDLIVLPSTINVKFNDIGGLEHIKRDLTETVLVPLIYPELTGGSRLCAPPLGVLFHGPPGTGKSMMAKAIARETNATFFNVDMSRLMSKWYGDSQKYISALFSLARKMAPSIIWIDEIDALFSQRSRSDHSADVYNKALFLSLWDGLANDIYKAGDGAKSSKRVQVKETAQVIILGASNRPQQVDEAFLRRMSRQYEFIMPDQKTRRLILGILLKTEKTHSDMDLNVIAEKTAFYSGSDLKELCKYAATLPLREYVRRRSARTGHRSHGSKSRNYNENVILDGVSSSTPDGSSPGPSSSSTTTTKGGGGGWTTYFGAGSGGNIAQEPTAVMNGNMGNMNSNNNKSQSVNVMDVFENENERFELRPIEQNDLLTALQHIKSTMKAHNEHKMKYGTGNKNSLFNGLGLFGLNGSSAYSRNNGQNGNTMSNGQNVDHHHQVDEDEDENEEDDLA